MSTQAACLPEGCRRRSSGIGYAPGHAPPAVSAWSADAGTDGAVPNAGAAADQALVPDSFRALYPIFLLRKVSEAEKAAAWRRYRGRWVRWTGTLVSFTRDGFVVRILPDTITFDVSVALDAGARPELERYRTGMPITFIGRLRSYDDVFYNFYLTHGRIIPPASDGGP